MALPNLDAQSVESTEPDRPFSLSVDEAKEWYKSQVKDKDPTGGNSILSADDDELVLVPNAAIKWDEVIKVLA